MPVQRQFTFHQRTQYDWINNGGHTHKNTTHQNIIMYYLEFIFLNCTAVMPPTLPLTFQCLSKFQFPFTLGWKPDLLMSSCITHLSFYLLQKKLLEFQLTTGLVNNIHMFLHVHKHQTWTQNFHSSNSFS